ncbi:MAG: (Fe-S)-binding protein, partial [Candidatus Thorarchaeota archaeon]
RSRIFESRPELVPRELHEVNKIVSKYSLSFEPWEDPDEKIESRLARLDRLGLPNIPDRRVKGATVLFYPGCQAEERSQEVRESAKLILDHFDVDYTMLDEMSCCGLPSRLVGDEKTSRVLFDTLMKRIQSTGAKIVVTTCAGCTGNLIEMSRRTGSTVPVLHMLEFLIEHIGKERLSRELASVRTPAEPIIVGLHHPCHLIRHTSRRLADYALEILGMIPGIDLRTTGVSDWCCGGGGMVGYHSRDVSDSVTTINVKGIVRSGVQRVLAPCPLCTAQIDSSLYRSGAKAEAEDLTVFVAQHLPLRRRTD